VHEGSYKEVQCSIDRGFRPALQKKRFGPGRLPRQVIQPGVRMDKVPRWFQGIRLNFAENILFSGRAGGTSGKEDAKIAVSKLTTRTARIRNT